MNSFRILLAAGLILIVTGISIMLASALVTSDLKLGGALIVFIGPFPVGVGFGEYAPILLLTSVIIALAMIILTYMAVRALKRKQTEE
ncbi:MAG: hypothetical protein ACUVQ0_04020 [Thermoproteota archaeon]